MCSTNPTAGARIRFQEFLTELTAPHPHLAKVQERLYDVSRIAKEFKMEGRVRYGVRKNGKELLNTAEVCWGCGDLCCSGEAGKAEAAKLLDAGISPKQCPGK